jgi:Protein of unknown function (DUF2384)
MNKPQYLFVVEISAKELLYYAGCFSQMSLLGCRGKSMPNKSPNPLDAPDLPPLEGENPDLRQEARDTLGEWWLKEPNIRLAGRTPEDLINENRGARVRDIVRSVKYIAIS